MGDWDGDGDGDGAAADGRTVCGFHHDDVAQYADQYYTHDMALDLREYRWRRLSNDVHLGSISGTYLKSVVVVDGRDDDLGLVGEAAE